MSVTHEDFAKLYNIHDCSNVKDVLAHQVKPELAKRRTIYLFRIETSSYLLLFLFPKVLHIGTLAKISIYKHIFHT